MRMMAFAALLGLAMAVNVAEQAPFGAAAAWWPFRDDGEGAAAPEQLGDAAGNGNDVSYAGGRGSAPQWAAAPVGDGRALVFGGDKCLLRYGDRPDASVRGIAHELSVLARFSPRSARAGTLVCCWAWKTAAGFCLSLQDGHMQLAWLYEAEQGKRVVKTAVSRQQLAENAWYESYAVLIEREGGVDVRFALSRDGADSWQTDTVRLESCKGPDAVGSTSSGNRTIGSRGWGDYFRGAIESLSIWDHALAATGQPVRPATVREETVTPSVTTNPPTPRHQPRAASAARHLPEPGPTDWVDDGPQWREMLRNSVVFAVQADLHSDRVLEADMKRIYADLPRVHADFTALCGDVVGAHNGLRESLNSPRPVFLGFGDHENFEEWGYIMVDENRPYRSPVLVPPVRRRSGTAGYPQEHQFGMMCAEMPYTEDWTGLPYWWSINYRGIHFVVIGGHKTQSVPSFYLEWFKRDLAENRDKTTVIFTHRIVFEQGNRWNHAGEWQQVVEANPQVKLIHYGHYHYAPSFFGQDFVFIGNALTMAAELVQNIPQGRKADDGLNEMGAYSLSVLSRDGVRVYMRYFDKPKPQGGAVLVQHYPFESSYDPSAPTSVSLPYLMTEHGTHYVPALSLRDASLRLWGVEREQMLPDPVFAAGSMPWSSVGSVALDAVAEPNPIDAPKLLQLLIPAAEGSDDRPARLASIDVDLPEKGRKQCWNTEEEEWAFGEYTYNLLALAKGPEGRRVWVIIDTVRPDGSTEASYTRKMTTSGREHMHYVFQETSCTWVRSQKSWQWTPGPHGKEEELISRRLPGPRQATVFRISLATPDVIARPEEWFVSAFLYTTSGYYTVPTIGRSEQNPAGRDFTRALTVRLGGKAYGSDVSLREGQTSAYQLGTVLGGTPFEVTRCQGSKLALVELKGEIDALMLHQIRQVTQTGGSRFVVGDTCAAPASNSRAQGVSRLSVFGKAAIDGHEIDIKRDGNHRTSATGTVIDVVSSSE